MPDFESLSDLVVLFGDAVPADQLHKGLAVLKPVPTPEQSGMNNNREKETGTNVRQFLKKVFPDTLFLVRFSGQQYLNVQSLKVYWPLFSESPGVETVDALLAPFFMPAAKLADAPPAEVTAFQKTFGSLFRLELLPRQPNAHDHLWHARRREKLLDGSIVVPVTQAPKSSPRKPRM